MANSNLSKKTISDSTLPRDVHPYTSVNKIRLITAASLFDGHDSTINIMRRILQSSGAEVIHLGHNRSVHEIVHCAIQEDVQGIALSSYQGGHMEYFSYMMELLSEQNANHIKVFGGGGGVFTEEEIRILESRGITKIFSVDDGAAMGLQGMINHILEHCDFDPLDVGSIDLSRISHHNPATLSRCISSLENKGEQADEIVQAIAPKSEAVIPVIGITGTGGAGKSSLTDELVRRFLAEFPQKTIAIVSVDPSRVKTGGALLGDRIRMNSIDTDRVFMRSMATRASDRATSAALRDVINLYRMAQFDLIIVETSGIGQSGAEIVDLTDLQLYVMTSEFGAATQLEKINMLDLADLIVLNKFEKKGSADALRDIRKQLQRNTGQWHSDLATMPVYPTIASQFNDEGVNRLFSALVDKINRFYGLEWTTSVYTRSEPATELHTQAIIPAKRVRYLSEIADTVRGYHKWVRQQMEVASKWGQLRGSIEQLELAVADEGELADELQTTDTPKTQAHELDGMGVDGMLMQRLGELLHLCQQQLDPESLQVLEGWDSWFAEHAPIQLQIQGEWVGETRENERYRTSLSGLLIPRVALPKTTDPAERLRFAFKENIPGYFPYTAGVFPLKREGEDPTRMFAGEGTPERTNKRFHYLSADMAASRLSTAFDSVTLYGEDPDFRPDIFGKIGNSGVNICTLDDMKKLYAGFELISRTTSVSMTINGPAPIILAMFMNTAIDQQVERYLKAKGEWEQALQTVKATFEQTGLQAPKYAGSLPLGSDGFGLGTLGVSGDSLVALEVYERIKRETLQVVRGTVQADILKEDQAQNTCIFSTEFALKMMGDVQAYFTEYNVRNYYSVSISGYHIAEAGANPITQAAFTLANGFTYVEYYLARGLNIDDFAHNLSFFFSNGLDPEYAVIGRVARRIWAIAMKQKYGANDRSQKLKYHIQTSGRSLHAKEIQFNDIRTTLQALLAVYDNCNSLHTNAYDEAITTPTEESVRRALAIQMIINKELGTAKNENPNQGSYFIQELTDLVEEAILQEFDRLTDRGGVLGAMESMYQRGKIQDESLHYETKKHSGELPIVGVNMFMSDHEAQEAGTTELIRSTEEEKQQQIAQLALFFERNKQSSTEALLQLKDVARTNGNIFSELMETVKVASLGQISRALYEVGGQYRRNM
jgi:isobutyryl-CoA mutase